VEEAKQKPKPSKVAGEDEEFEGFSA